MLLFNNKTFSAIYSNGYNITAIYHGAHKVWPAQQSLTEAVTLLFGVSNSKPQTIQDIISTSKVTIDTNALLHNGIMQTILTGDSATGQGQYPVLICPKTVKLLALIKWTVAEVDFIPLSFETVETNQYNIYYLNTQTYDEDIGGTQYSFLFKEG